MTDLIGLREWGYSDTPVRFTHGCEGCEEEDDGMTDFMTLTGHVDEYYNGVYWQTDDWGGYPHFVKESGDAHLFHLDSGSGYWQLDFRNQEATGWGELLDYYDGGYTSGGWNAREVLDGDVAWSGGNTVNFEWGTAEFDPSTIVIAVEEEEVAYVEENFVWWIQAEGHPDDFYDGLYTRSADWNDHPHFEKPDGSAHLYFLDTGSGYWQFDYRQQDGTSDYYDGGYMSANPWLEAINGTVEFSAGYITITQGFEEWDCDQGGCEVEALNMYIRLTGHDSDYYNGNYWFADSWNGFPHFAKEDGSAHLYFLDSGAGYW